MSLKPSRSGIARALAGGAATVIHDLGEFARELIENGLVETADVESLRQQLMTRDGPHNAGGAGRGTCAVWTIDSISSGGRLAGQDERAS